MFKIVLIALAFAAVMFGLQRLVFDKSERRLVHLVPVFITIAVYAVSVGLCVFNELNPTGFMFYTFVGIITAAVNTAGLVGVGIAWLIEKV